MCRKFCNAASAEDRKGTTEGMLEHDQVCRAQGTLTAEPVDTTMYFTQVVLAHSSTEKADSLN